MEAFLVWLMFTILVGHYSRSKGHGFASGFCWAFFLSPVIGALITAMRPACFRPGLYRLLPSGATVSIPPPDTDAPRPMFCAVLILVIFLGILVLV